MSIRQRLGSFGALGFALQAFAILVSLAVILSVIAVAYGWRSEHDIREITRRVVKIERPTKAQRDAGVQRAVKGISRHNARVLMGILLRNMTPRQKALIRGPRGPRGRTSSAIGRSPVGVARIRRRSSARRLAPPRSPTASLGEQIARDTCTQIHRAMPQAVC